MFHERDCRIATPKESTERNNKDKEGSQYYWELKMETGNKTIAFLSRKNLETLTKKRGKM